MISICFYCLLMMCAIICGFPHNNAIGNVIHRVKELEASGGDTDEPFRGTVKVVRLSPHFLHQASLIRRGAGLRSGQNPKSPLPAFLALGRPGPASSNKGALHSALPHSVGSSVSVDMKKRQGLQMWQRAMEKNTQDKDVVPLPINLKETTKQNCAAVPFTQRVTEAGCESVSVHNKLCFGQCASLYIPPGGDSTGTMPVGSQRSSPCSRCAPSKSRYVTVTLRCRGTSQLRERHVMIVEECKCATGREDDPTLEMAVPYMKR